MQKEKKKTSICHQPHSNLYCLKDFSIIGAVDFIISSWEPFNHIVLKISRLYIHYFPLHFKCFYFIDEIIIISHWVFIPEVTNGFHWIYQVSLTRWFQFSSRFSILQVSQQCSSGLFQHFNNGGPSCHFHFLYIFHNVKIFYLFFYFL